MIGIEIAGVMRSVRLWTPSLLPSRRRFCREPKLQIPLPVRFVGVRIDKIEAALALGHVSVAEKEMVALRIQIAAFTPMSVAIREAQAQVAHCYEEAFWQPLTAEHFAFLRQAFSRSLASSRRPIAKPCAGPRLGCNGAIRWIVLSK